MSSAPTLDLICPGLLGPVPTLPPPFPKTPTLDQLLSRADKRAASLTDPPAVLLAEFGVFGEPDRDLPTAPLCLLGEDPTVDPDAWWMHADPVHLRADRDRLLLFAGAAIAPDRDEADALVALFNAHFGDAGLWLLAPTPGRWYLRVDRPPDLRTQPLQRVLGGPIGHALPSGPDASRWNALLNEAQMLFFGSAVNRARERQGRPAISGLWVWGGGDRPTLAGDLPAVLVGDHPLTLGLARHAGRRHLTLAQWRDDSPSSAGPTVVYWDALQSALQEQDVLAWANSLRELESCLQGTAKQLRDGGVSRIVIDPCQGMRWRISRSQLRRFWRRQGLRSLLELREALTER
ncbi:phosphoglycerate mutase [Thiocystis minor]|uniref:phosphoglycerate mutase n=1 Tax=Thiocystis minor TaxID=61597 RepID=UPI0019131C3C|nr:phosphoglycerate mutase [Thiocystis minor]MBK5965296.1 phosphoglycerate mutase [Thiocystis minor]